MKLTIIAFFLFVINCSGKRPEDLGIREGKLKPCPESPNCVSSEVANNDKVHYIPYLTYTQTKEEAKSKLKKIILELPRTNLIKEESNYLYFEFTSRIMRYVDDVEFTFDDTAKVIQVRSASRLGKGDMGVNRKRIESIRELFH
ncbi:MAG: DUF1499 domain-containing protein [Leptospiraceae bacterium]|nr:DUF1499 domain-containing protein [Leptospiraceae bacterium]